MIKLSYRFYAGIFWHFFEIRCNQLVSLLAQLNGFVDYRSFSSIIKWSIIRCILFKQSYATSAQFFTLLFLFMIQSPKSIFWAPFNETNDSTIDFFSLPYIDYIKSISSLFDCEKAIVEKQIETKISMFFISLSF